MLGEGKSKHLLLLGGLNPCSFPPCSEWAWACPPLSGPCPHSESDTTALALALSFSFSLSVWLTGLGLGIPRPTVVLLNPVLSPEAGSFSLDVCGAPVAEALIDPEDASPVVLMGRAELGRVRVRVLVLAGRGRERYWRDVLALADRKPLWSLVETSRLVLRPALPLELPPPGLTGIPDILGIFPAAVGPQGMLQPPVPRMTGTTVLLVQLPVAVVFDFLKPKFPPVEGLTRPEGGLRCSPAPLVFLWSLPASEEERWRPEVFTANLDLSIGFPSDLAVPKGE